MNLTNLELTRDNSTSSSVYFKCKDGFRPRDEQMAVCSSDGMWLPDLTQFECHGPTAAMISMILACFSIIHIKLYCTCSILRHQHAMSALAIPYNNGRQFNLL